MLDISLFMMLCVMVLVFAQETRLHKHTASKFTSRLDQNSRCQTKYGTKGSEEGTQHSRVAVSLLLAQETYRASHKEKATKI